MPIRFRGLLEGERRPVRPHPLHSFPRSMAVVSALNRGCLQTTGGTSDHTEASGCPGPRHESQEEGSAGQGASAVKQCGWVCGRSR